ncbi:MAG: hypothetical protein DSY84_00285, partial [Candidatus Neomarinimicrobiota bacterium]
MLTARRGAAVRRGRGRHPRRRGSRHARAQAAPGRPRLGRPDLCRHPRSRVRRGTALVPDAETYARALERAYADANLAPGRVSYLETHGSGDPREDRVEAEALSAFFGHDDSAPCAIGSAKPTIGHTGAAAGLASVVKTAICLYQETIPPLGGFERPSAPDAWRGSPFHMPIRPHAWLRDRADGPRCAGVCVMTFDGGCAHVVLEGVERQADAHAVERAQPLGSRDQALFGVCGRDAAAR